MSRLGRDKGSRRSWHMKWEELRADFHQVADTGPQILPFSSRIERHGAAFLSLLLVEGPVAGDRAGGLASFIYAGTRCLSGHPAGWHSHPPGLWMRSPSRMVEMDSPSWSEDRRP